MTERPQHGQFGEALTQTVLETRQVVDVALVFGAADNRFNRRMPAPEIGTAQSADTRYFHEQFPLSGSVRMPAAVAGSLLVVPAQAMVKVSSPVRMISGPMPRCPGRAAGGEDILDLEVVTPTVGQRNALQADDRVSSSPLASTTRPLRTNTAFALRPVFDEGGQVGVGSKEDHFAVAQGAISTSIGWLRIEYRGTRRAAPDRPACAGR
jgi:hypothetical protein